MLDLEMRVSTLKEALTAQQGVTGVSNVFPALSHVLLESDKADAVRISTTNTALFLAADYEAEVDSIGALLLPMSGLMKIVRAFGSGSIRILGSEAHAARLESGRSEARLVGLDPSAFPGPVKVYKPEILEVPHRTFGEALSAVIYAASTEPARINLNGVFVDVVGDGKVLKVAATDGHRLATIRRDLDKPAKMPRRLDRSSTGITIPTKGASILASILQAADEEAEVVVSVSENAISVSEPGREFRALLIEELFPDYDQVIPTSFSRSFKVSRDGFLGLVRRSSALLDKGSGIALTADRGTLSSSATNATFGEVSDAIDVDYESDRLTMVIDARYIKDALGNLPDGTIECRLSDSLSPLLLLSEADPDLRAVVMPMRL